MRCGDCQYWRKHESYGEERGECEQLTSAREGGVATDNIEAVAADRAFVGYDGWTVTHKDFFCAAFKERGYAQT